MFIFVFPRALPRSPRCVFRIADAANVGVLARVSMSEIALRSASASSASVRGAGAAVHRPHLVRDLSGACNGAEPFPIAALADRQAVFATIAPVRTSCGTASSSGNSKG